MKQQISVCRLIQVNANTLKERIGPASPDSPWVAAVVTQVSRFTPSRFEVWVFPCSHVPGGCCMDLHLDQENSKWQWPPRVEAVAG